MTSVYEKRVDSWNNSLLRKARIAELEAEIEKYKSGHVRIGEVFCKHCGHTWLPRTPWKPRVCPSCHSHNYDKEPVTKHRKETKDGRE